MFSSLRKLEILSVAHFHHPPGLHPKPRIIAKDQLCIELVTGGRGWIEHENDWVEVNPGALLWNGPGEYTIGRNDFENPYRCLSVRCRYQGRFQRATPRITKWDDLDSVRQFTDQAVRLFYEESFNVELLTGRIMGELQFRAGYYAWASDRQEAPKPLLLAQQAIERDYAQPLSVEDLAELSGWSAPHMHAEFRRHFGESPHQALIARRMRAAKVQLAATNNPIKQIAVECGFSGASAFCTAFRRQTGVTPAVFRQQQQHGAR
ncbi:AraC family transcriptional regulator [Cerasicoccus fimbriatus]|uniref:AraC family transcriptional regulator n=1 Tax=Cerasicoccus fimbriatus TaxID=3014554 RepID=UPI0022B3F414|nr:AraC family transcriptional regulator [Cerasicoccus sp. TK19100]